jgi:hypothetical protein
MSELIVLTQLITNPGSRVSAVGIATGYGLDDLGVGPGRVKNFLFSTSSRPALGSTQPHIHLVSGSLLEGKAAEA